MIIGIDIDDTISETCEVMFSFAQEFTVDVLKKEPIIREDSCQTHLYIQYMHDFKDSEDREFLKQYYEEIMKQVKPKTLATKYLKKLQDEGNKIVLITARWEEEGINIRKLTEDWIKENNIPCDKLIINAENKLIAAKQENIDLFIDDSFKNCNMVSEAGIKTFLMDSRANKGLKTNNVERVYSWPHIYMKIKELQEVN